MKSEKTVDDMEGQDEIKENKEERFNRDHHQDQQGGNLEDNEDNMVDLGKNSERTVEDNRENREDI